MGTRSRRLWLSLMLMATIGAGCGTTWSEEPAPWRLHSEPTDSTIRVWAEFGGSSCTRFVDWRLDESETTVSIQAVIERSDEEACTSDLVIIHETLQLERPLGSRTLTGCEPENEEQDCRMVVPGPPESGDEP